MDKASIHQKKKMLFILFACEISLVLLIVRVFYIQFFMGDEISNMAYEQQTRDRTIPPERGVIYDRNMTPIADNETVGSVSVIPNQVQDKEQVSKVLSEELNLNYDDVYKKVNHNVALERISTKVDKSTADEISAMNMPGVVVDEDIKRVYPYSNMAAQVIGFSGKDNQGIIGLESQYNEYLAGKPGEIQTETNVKGHQSPSGNEYRVEPEPGDNLVTSLDVTLEQYCEQALDKILEAKQAKQGALILMNPQNGEIYAMANKPDFDLNEPFTPTDPDIQSVWSTFTNDEKLNYLNQMWRNFCINDTYEPGSTFKIFTSAAALDSGAVKPDDMFNCTGSIEVAGRQIKCWRYPRAHGPETFVEGVYNSCNPVFITVAENMGAETFYNYMNDFGFLDTTGIDLPGEARGIMHKEENIGPVELATMSFGQSFQITPVELLAGASAVINGGYLVTPHLGTEITDDQGNVVKTFDYPKGKQVISTQTSDTMRDILEGVVTYGSGNKAYIPGFQIGGKTATSEKLPRRQGKYIASFLAFAPADDPQVIGLVIIDEPQGIYYGGTIAGPVMNEVMQNTLPYLGVEPEYNEAEQSLPEVQTADVPDLSGMSVSEAKSILKDSGLTPIVVGEGDVVNEQFPPADSSVKAGTKVIVYASKQEDYDEYVK